MSINHEKNVEQVLDSPTKAAQSPLAASWCRSGLKHGLIPAEKKGRLLVSGSELTLRRRRHELMVNVARPLLDQLHQTVSATGCAVMLSDDEGVILEARSQAGDREMFEDVGLTPGGVWREEVEGTNGIGTCLAEGRTITIHRDEHFASRNIGISCMDAPVYDAEGRLAGALDVSSCRDDHTTAVAVLMQKLVQNAARRIERGMFIRHFEGKRIIDVNEPCGDAALIAVDRDDILIGATKAARIQYQLTDACLTGCRPAGELLGDGETVSFIESERSVLRQAMARAGGNATRAAAMLGIGRATLYRRLEKARLAAQ